MFGSVLPTCGKPLPQDFSVFSPLTTQLTHKHTAHTHTHTHTHTNIHTLMQCSNDGYGNAFPAAPAVHPAARSLGNYTRIQAE